MEEISPGKVFWSDPLKNASSWRCDGVGDPVCGRYGGTQQQKSKGKVLQPAAPDLVTQSQQAHGGPSSRKCAVALNTKHHTHMALQHAQVLITCNVATLEFNDNALETKKQQFEDGDTLC
eukprot:1148899-Pelagomonas_calceolata.AAC.2